MPISAQELFKRLQELPNRDEMSHEEWEEWLAKDIEETKKKYPAIFE